MPKTYFCIGAFYPKLRLPKMTEWLLEHVSLEDYGILSNAQWGTPSRLPIGIGKIFNQLITAAFYDVHCTGVWVLGDDIVLDNSTIGMFESIMFAADYPFSNELSFPREMTAGTPKFNVDVSQSRVDCLYPSLNCAYIPRTVWNAVGVFDEKFPLGHYQDLDYGVRAWRSRCWVTQDNRWTIEHNKESTFRQMEREGSFDYSTANEGYKYLKQKYPWWGTITEEEAIHDLRRGIL